MFESIVTILNILKSAKTNLELLAESSKNAFQIAFSTRQKIKLGKQRLNFPPLLKTLSLPVSQEAVSM